MEIVELDAGLAAVLELVKEDEKLVWVGDKAQGPRAGGLVALDGDRAVGFAVWAPMLGMDGVDQFHITPYTREGHRDSGFERRLWADVPRRFQDLRCGVWVHLDDSHAYLAEMIEAAGMQHAFTAVTYKSALPLPRIEPMTDPRLVRYTGGDDAVDAEIVSIFRRGFAGRAGVPECGPVASENGQKWILAYEGDRLAGFIVWLPWADEAFCESVVVARPYFGTGLAHSLGCAFSDDALAEGFATVVCHIHETNHASRSLVERLGFVARSETKTYVAEFGGAAG